MSFRELVQNITYLHSQYEQDSSKLCQITITRHHHRDVIIGDMEKRAKYRVTDMKRYKELEGTYRSPEEFDKAAEKDGRSRVFMSVPNLAIEEGHGRLEIIGKVKVLA